ncbi:MAG: N-acetyltransferase [Lachnospiraceae bacterium]|nr:N-acetyltransferase [Lachnospiraceae bacterium]
MRGCVKQVNIRKASMTDLQEILQIYAHARERMRQNGNPSQWGERWPWEEVVAEDIEAGQSFVTEEEGKICGVFAFLPGIEPTYQKIENGSWLNEEAYGTIHRLAGDGWTKGVFAACQEYCGKIIPNIRIDTHADNHIMRHLLDKHGFKTCGIIYVEDGTPRIAYQKVFGSWAH